MGRGALTLTCLLTACSSTNDRQRADEIGEEAGIYFHDAARFAPVREEDYGAALAETLVRQIGRCCAEAGLDFEARAQRMTDFERGFVHPASSSGARFQPDAAAACLAMIEKRACPNSKEATPEPPDNPCESVYVGGTRGPDERCSSQWECARDESGDFATCLRPGTASSACAVRHVALEGEPCTNSDGAHCAAHLLCDPERGVCVARAQFDEPCVTGPGFGDTCAAGAVCDRLGEKRCVRPRMIGERCSAPEQCEDFACIDGACREALALFTICGEPRTGPLRR